MAKDAVRYHCRKCRPSSPCFSTLCNITVQGNRGPVVPTRFYWERQRVKYHLQSSDTDSQSFGEKLDGLGSPNGSALTGSMPLGRLLDFSTSHFPHLKNEDNNPHRILWGLDELIFTKCVKEFDENKTINKSGGIIHYQSQHVIRKKYIESGKWPVCPRSNFWIIVYFGQLLRLYTKIVISSLLKVERIRSTEIPIYRWNGLLKII